MRRRVLANAVALADAVTDQVVLAGGAAPDRADLLRVLLPSARLVTDAARSLDRARRLAAEAEVRAQAAGATASGVLAALVHWYLGQGALAEGEPEPARGEVTGP
jgi:hypothetical protein